MRFQVNASLTPDAARIREEVFMKEQGFVEEFDDIDGISRHVVLYDGEEAVGVCRLFRGETDGVFVVGRLAVMPRVRGMGLGARVLAEAERLARESGGARVELDAQTRARGFYERLGYRAEGDEFLEEYCPHIRMWKAL